MHCPPLLCTVRGCQQPLIREGRAFRCEQGHSFDIAREGYVNLLQPQDRRSLNAGDSREAVEARASLLSAGIGGRNLAAIAAIATALDLPGERPVVADLGSGSGEVLARLAAARSICGVGIDISVAASSHAARAVRGDSVTWVVANADRRLPLVQASVSLVLSVQGRRNPQECRRVLAADGFLIVSVPAPEDLAELREHVQGARLARERVRDVIQTHAASFRVVDQQRVEERHVLERDQLLKLLRGTYRGIRASQTTRVASLDRLEVTLASDIVTLQFLNR